MFFFNSRHFCDFQTTAWKMVATLAFVKQTILASKEELKPYKHLMSKRRLSQVLFFTNFRP